MVDLKDFSQKTYFWPVVLALVAFILRLAYLWELGRYSFVNQLSLDPGFYDRWGLKIASGQLFSPRAFFAAPLYAYLLGFIYAMAGHNYFLVRILQIILGSLNILLLFYLGEHYFTRRAAYLAAVLYVFYGVFYFYEGQILKSSLEISLNLVFLAFIVRHEQKNAWKNLLGAGIFLGLAAAVRGNVLLFVPFLYLFWYLKQPKNWLKPCLIITGGLLLAIAPFTIHNYLVSQEFVLINSNGGVNFYIGNNPQADGTFKTPPGVRANMEYEEVDYLKVTKNLTGQELSPAALSRYWAARGWRYLLKNPYKSLKLYGRKTLIFWNQEELADNQDYYFYRDLSFILRILPSGFGIVAPLGLAGLIVFYQKWREYLLLYLFITIYFLSTILFFIFARYRLGILPLLILFASAFLIYLWDEFTQRRWRPLSLALVFLILTSALVYWPLPGFKNDHTLALSYNKYGYYYYKERHYETALQYFDKALQYFPGYAEAYNRQAITHLALGNFPAAAASFKKALAIMPDFPEALLNYAQLLEKTDPSAAISTWQEYLKVAQNIPAEAQYLPLAKARLKKLQNQEKP